MSEMKPSLPFDLDQVFNAIHVGLIIVDADERVLLWNDWIAIHSQIPAQYATEKKLSECFNEAPSAAFLTAIQKTLSHGLPTMLSNALHRSPLPLYAASGLADRTLRISQSITMMPIVDNTGATCCLIQISDSSKSVKREKMLRSHSDVLRKEATMDGLTGIYNRRFFDEHFKMAIAQAKRQKQALSVFMIDVDYFKEYNDTYGHLAGDKALVLIADTMRAQLVRKTDIVARYGGEEFVILTPGMSSEGALIFADNVRLQIEALHLEHQASQVSAHLSISIGVSTMLPDTDTDARTLLMAADNALYQAKENGRNQFHALPISEFTEKTSSYL